MFIINPEVEFPSKQGMPGETKSVVIQRIQFKEMSRIKVNQSQGVDITHPQAG
jgi:hypothetical protein